MSYFRKNPHTPTDGMLEILTGGGLEGSAHEGSSSGIIKTILTSIFQIFDLTE